MASTTTALPVALTDSPHTFIQPPLPLYTDTLAYLKHTLDPLAVDVSAAQQQRQQEARKKRKRGDAAVDEKVLRLKQIHTQGFGVEQVWEQARRVIEAARLEAEKAVVVAEAQRNGVGVDHDEDNSVEEDCVEDEVEGSDDGEDLGEEGVDYEVEGMNVDGEEIGIDDEDDVDLNAALDDYDEDDMDMDAEPDDKERVNNVPADEFVADKFGLNDGFFSIDNFNKQSDFLEQQDARGENDGAASDEEDVDWDAPLTQLGGTNGAAEEDSELEDENAPTFGDPDASSEDEDEGIDGDEMDGMGMGMGNTNDIMYKDFFAPPAQKKKKNKKGRPNPHNFPEHSNPTEDQEDDVERTMAAVHRDIFDESDPEPSEAEDTQKAPLDPADPKSRRSAHERRKAAFEQEFRKLEAVNVGKRDWVLSGEARAVDRPMNSLLEQDLDFERAGKSVPIITAEVSEGIEELIKRRILAHEFQDIIRRRPDDADASTRRGRLNFELDDCKSKKGLAEEYEEEHLRNTDPNFIDAKDERTKKEEQEITALWKKVCGELDSLSSWHFRPKQAAPQLDIRVDAPVVSMEDARPNAGGEVAGASQLAPQEIYNAAGRKSGSEVVGKSGLPVGREEMEREDRKRRRRREKERIRKKSGNEGSKGGEGKGQGKRNEMLGDLKKGGVKVIGKKGDVKDVEGNDVREKVGEQHGGGRFKL